MVPKNRGVSDGDSTQLVYLRARYYNPADGRFQSRDTWGGDANRPMSMNRWMYVEGNPVNLIDPSGHFSTLVSEQLAQVINIPVTFESNNTNKILIVSNNINSDCSSLFGIGYGEKLRSILKKRYDWNLSNSLIGVSWSDYDILTVFNTANDIEQYIDKLTSSKGRQWMRNYLGGVKMTIEKTGRGFGVPSWIGLLSWWSKAAIDTKKYYVTHELGHIWDAHTGHLGAETTAHDEHLHYRMYGIVGGVADELNTFIISHEGGTNFIEGTTDSRFYNPNDPSYVDPHIPTNYQWASTKWSSKLPPP